MDLTCLYELRDRLRSGAIAGAALAADDFRLRRALDALEPLEKAAPVFARLGQLTRNLLAPDCPDRAGALLDALTLADAVLCTQGAVAVPGGVEPLALSRRGSALSNAPYSVLAPLLEALTTSGGGRYSFVVDTHDQRPELFRDWRVKDALVQALGAAYAELADRAEAWLSSEDETLLPLLRSGFDPHGKKDMVRRVRVMEALAGAEANDFYLSQLPEAEKDVRAALIYALRHSEGNADKLVELCKTEKGACKKAAHWALAKLDAPAAWDYWSRLAVKKPDQAAEYMVLSTSSRAGVLVAEALDRLLDGMGDAPTAEDANRLQTLLFALPGKAGPEICACYRRMAALGTALDWKSFPGAGGQETALRLRAAQDDFSRDALPFSEVLPLVLRRSILLRPTPDLLALPGELERVGEASYAVPSLTAALLSRPAAEAYALAEPFLRPAGLLKNKRPKSGVGVLRAALDGLRWDEAHGTPVYRVTYADPAAGRSIDSVLPLHEPLDGRWYDRLTALNAGDALDGVLARLIPQNDAALRARIGAYFYQRALHTDNNRHYLPWLRACGWNKCQGLLEAYCKRHKVNTWDVRSYLSQMPGTAEELAAEAERVLALIREKRIAVGSWNPTTIQQWLTDLGNAAPIQLTGGNA